MAKRFIVVGHARAGSTFLIERLAGIQGVQTPHVNHEELFNVYEKLFNARTLRLDGSCEVAMLNSFFAGVAGEFVGLKTIPSFHRQWREIASLSDIQFITISRNNVLDCVASMLVCRKSWNWQIPARNLLKQGPMRFSEWFPSRKAQEMILGELLNRLLFDLRELEQLDARHDTISLSCELLSTSNGWPQLDDFFGQPIELQGFRPPTSYRECFTDADVFCDTITTLLKQGSQYDSHIPRVVRELVVAVR